jgi:hypothetical protein
LVSLDRSPTPSSGDALRRAPAMATPRLRRVAPAASPLRRILIIYAILALAVFAFPGGIVDWLDERNSSGWLDAPLTVARGIDAVSAAAGLKGVGVMLRKRFAALVGDDEG